MNSTWNSIFKPEAIWKAMMLLTEPVSHSDIFWFLPLFDLFRCVCLIQSSPFAIFDSSEVKNVIYLFPLSYSLLFLMFSFPLLRFLSGHFSFTINLLSPVHYGFSSFSVLIPCSRIIYVRTGQCLNRLLCHSHRSKHTHTHLHVHVHVERLPCNAFSCP